MKQNNILSNLNFTITLAIFMLLTYPFLKTDLDNGCTPKVFQTMKNKFYHTDISHLFLDIISLLFLYELEKELGLQGMFIVFIVSLVFVSIFETTLVNIFPNIECSPGLFAVFVSIGTFDALKSVPNKYIITAIVIIGAIIFNMISNNNLRYINDFIGSFTGLVLALTC